MTKLLVVLLPIGLAGAVSPMLLTEEMLLLSLPGGRKASRWFALAAILVLSLLVCALVLFGRAIAMPHISKHTSAQVDVGLGVLLLLLAVYGWRKRPAEKEKPAQLSGMDARAAFSFGLFSMATNFTTIFLMVPGAREIAESKLALPERAVATVFLIMLAAIPVWLPLLLTWIAPGAADRALGALGNALQKHGRQIATPLISIVGIYLTARGITYLS